MPLTLDPPRLVPDIVDDGTRREFIAGGLTLAALLAGCGDDGASKPRAGDGYPRTIQHAGGRTTLPTKPTRIYVTRSGAEMDAVLALGVKPVLFGTFPGRTLAPWQTAAGEKATPALDVSDGPNLEKMTAARIDLIIANEDVFNGAKEEIAAYRKVAPLVVLPNADIPRQLRVVARCCDVAQHTVDTRVAGLEARLDEFHAARVPKSVAVISGFFGGQVYVFTPFSDVSQMFTRIGLPAISLPRSAKPKPTDYQVAISPERIGEIDADLVIGFLFDGEDADMDKLEAMPLFKHLPGVKAGNYHRLDLDESNSLASLSALSTPVALAALTKVTAA